MTSKQISEPIETHYDAATGRMKNYYVCRDCADGRAGFCMDSVLHRVAMARKLSSLEQRRNHE